MESSILILCFAPDPYGCCAPQLRDDRFPSGKTGKTHLKPLIMQTREPLAPAGTPRSKNQCQMHLQSLASHKYYKINKSNIIGFMHE